MRATASNLYVGGGTGFSLHQVGAERCLYDTSRFDGIDVWVKGTTRGAYSNDAGPRDNTLRIQLESGTDEYGFLCAINPDNWTLCSAPA
jgi:hypothetical protein